MSPAEHCLQRISPILRAVCRLGAKGRLLGRVSLLYSNVFVQGIQLYDPSIDFDRESVGTLLHVVNQLELVAHRYGK